MDQDVKLSMEQAHEKWITKGIIWGVLGLAILASGTCVGYERIDKTAEVQKVQLERDKAQADSMKAMWDHMPPAPSPASSH